MMCAVLVGLAFLACTYFCCCYVLFALVVAAFAAISYFVNPLPDPLHESLPESALSSQGFLDIDFSSQTMVLLAIGLLLLVVLCCCCCRAQKIFGNSIALVVLSACSYCIYYICSAMELNYLLPQFIICAAVIMSMSSCCYFYETSQEYSFSFPATLVCCIYPSVILVLFSALVFVVSISEGDDETYWTFIYKFGFPFFVWLCKYITTIAMLWASGAFILLAFPRIELNLNKSPATEAIQVTEFAFKELVTISKTIGVISVMGVSYWVFTLIFSDVPYVLSYGLIIELSFTGGVGLCRLLIKDGQSSVPKPKVLYNTCAFLTSMLVYRRVLGLVY